MNTNVITDVFLQVPIHIYLFIVYPIIRNHP